MARRHKRAKGIETVSFKPGWIGSGIDVTSQQNSSTSVLSKQRLERLFHFYVLKTPVKNVSSMSVSLRERGWGPKPWTSEESNLRSILLDDFGFSTNDNLYVCTAVDETSALFRDAGLDRNFKRTCKTEKLAFYHSESSQFMSIARHLRNSLAHGRFAAKKQGNDILLFFEDGKRAASGFAVRSRMVLKYSTLESWMRIISKEN